MLLNGRDSISEDFRVRLLDSKQTSLRWLPQRSQCLMALQQLGIVSAMKKEIQMADDKPILDPATLRWIAAYLEKDLNFFYDSKTRNKAYLIGFSEALHSVQAVAERVSRGEDPRLTSTVTDMFPDLPLEKRFKALLNLWHRETGHLSNLTKSNAHPAHRAIISMGPPVVPLIAAEMEREPGWYFDALQSIIGDGPDIPEEARGRLNVLTKIYLDWLRSRG